MTYTQLALAALAGAVAVDALLLRTWLLCKRIFWTAYGIVLFFQLVVNGVLTGLPVVTYDPRVIIGVRVAFAPLEDLLFGFAMVVLTLSTWVWLGRREATRPGRRPAPRGRRPTPRRR